MLQLAPPVPRRAAIAQLPEVTPARGDAARPDRAHAGLRPARLLRRRQRRDGARARAPRAGRSTRRAAPRCCGSLQMHAGVEDEAIELAQGDDRRLRGLRAVAVNVAGCGSGMKDYAHLLADDPEWAERAAAFSAKVRDVSELLAEHEPQAPRHPLPLRVAYHDACHLAHAQKVRVQPRALLRAIPELELLEPADWELCCGSAGIYNLVQPEAAAELGARKAANLAATGADADRRRQPRLRAADRRAPGRPGLPPHDPARPLDPRDPPMSHARRRRPCATSGSRRDPQRRGARLRRRAARALRARRQELLAARRERAAELRARRDARLPARDARDPRGRLARRRAAGRLPRPARRDHRADRPQARHQRAQLGRARASWPTSRTRTPPPGPTRSAAT